MAHDAVAWNFQNGTPGKELFARSSVVLPRFGVVGALMILCARHGLGGTIALNDAVGNAPEFSWGSRWYPPERAPAASIGR
jgi:hypothetical protein